MPDKDALKAWALNSRLPALYYVVTQAILFFYLLVNKSGQEEIPAQDEGQYYIQHHEADPPWDDYVSGWNGQAFREIATNGYPVPLPTNEDGEVMKNPWAFFPLFPLLCRIPMAFGLSFGYSAIMVSLVFGFAAVLVMYNWILSYSKSKWVASLAALSLCLFPSMALMQLAYAEGVALFFTVCILCLIHNGRYLTAIIPVALLGLTRPVGPPDLALVLMHGLYMLYTTRNFRPMRVIGLLRRSDKAQRYALLTVASAVSAVLWSLLGFIATGKNAYVETHGAFFGGGQVFFAWLSPATIEASAAYPLTPGAILAFFVVWALFMAIYNGAKEYPPILRIWPLVLAAYIFTFTTPIGNEIRYLLLGLFMVPFAKMPETKVGRFFYFIFIGFLFILALYAQWKWVSIHWVSVEGQLRKNV